MKEPPAQGVDGPQSAGLSPPRFTVRALFAMIGVVAVVLTVWKSFGPAMGLMLVLMLIIVGAHMVGNALGNRLRDRGTQHAVAAWREAALPSELPAPRGATEPHHFAPVTRLSHRTSLGWFPAIVTALGGIAGAIGGGWALRQANPDAATVATLTLGCLATGTLAALWSFWMFSLLQVFLGAWWQADRHGQRQ